MWRKTNSLFKWTPLLILVIIIASCVNTFLSVTVIGSLVDVALVTLQGTQTTLKHGEDWRKQSKPDSESQMDYVPDNVRNLHQVQAMNGTSQKQKLHKAGSGRISSLERKNQIEKDIKVRANKAKIIQVDQPAESEDKNDVGKNVNAETEISGSEPKVPETFNEEFIRYFWKHPELYKRYKEMENALKTQKENIKVSESGKQDTNGKVDTKVESKYTTYITLDSARGNLGNQMFQLASLIGLATVGNFTPILPLKEFNTNMIFKTKFQLYPNSIFKHFVKFTDENKTIETSVRQSKCLNTHANWTLDGYFQSFKYFAHAIDEVKQLFEFKDVYLTSARQFIHKNVPANTMKIAIHIWRQDFISSYQTKLGRVEVTADYVKKAQEYFLTKFTNISFIVVSDDQTWCHQNIHGDNVVFSFSKSMGTDLAIMKECDHVIISVGTFGWWGGWLAGGMVIYYKHYPRPGSYLDSVFNPHFYYPKSWIPME